MAEVSRAIEIHTTGHFVYTRNKQSGPKGGRHGWGYLNCRPLLRPTHRPLLAQIMALLADRVVNEVQPTNTRQIVLVGMEGLGELMIGLINAEIRSLNLRVVSRIIKKDTGTGSIVWKTPQEEGTDPRASHLFVDDVLNNGTTFLAAKHLVGDIETPFVVATMYDRCNVTAAELGVERIVTLESRAMASYEPDACALCISHQPIVRRPGHGWEFERECPDYPGGFVNL